MGWKDKFVTPLLGRLGVIPLTGVSAGGIGVLEPLRTDVHTVQNAIGYQNDPELLNQLETGAQRISDLEKQLGLYKQVELDRAVTMRELSTAAASIAESVEQQSNRTSDSLKLLSEMSTSFEESEGHLDTLQEEVEDAMTIRSEAKSKLAELYDSGLLTEEKIQGMSESITALTAMAKDVLNVLSFIDDISSSTNILSLNASIEAARAGEAGRGFAVISQEIRRLATTTKDHSATIRDRLSTVVDTVGSLSVSMDASLSSLHDQKRAASASKAAFAIVDNLFGTVEEVANDIKSSFDHAGKLKAGIVAALTSIAEEAEAVSAATEQVSASMEYNISETA